jgi:hypothetical protein
MQQKSLPHKTGSLSKILMGTAMVGFFGIFSPNTAASAAECYLLHTQHECESDSACHWVLDVPYCVGSQHCFGLDETTCRQTPGCHMTEPPGGDTGTCQSK